MLRTQRNNLSFIQINFFYWMFIVETYFGYVFTVRHTICEVSQAGYFASLREFSWASIYGNYQTKITRRSDTDWGISGFFRKICQMLWIAMQNNYLAFAQYQIWYIYQFLIIITANWSSLVQNYLFVSLKLALCEDLDLRFSSPTVYLEAVGDAN